MAQSNKSFWNISPWIWPHHRPEVSARTESWGCTEGNPQHGAAEPGMSQREAGKAAGISWLWEGSRNLPGVGRHLGQPIWASLLGTQGLVQLQCTGGRTDTSTLPSHCIIRGSAGLQNCSTGLWAAFTLTFQTASPLSGEQDKAGALGNHWVCEHFSPPAELPLQIPSTQRSQMTFSHSAQNHCIIFVNTGSHGAGRFTAKPRTRTATNWICAPSPKRPEYWRALICELAHGQQPNKGEKQINL